jgi:TPR repeat protein
MSCFVELEKLNQWFERLVSGSKVDIEEFVLNGFTFKLGRVASYSKEYNICTIRIDFMKYPQEYIKLMECFVECGNGVAMFNLGKLYAHHYKKAIKNEVVVFDYEKAMKYYKMAIDKGIGRAMNNLGNMYEVGKGVERNYEEAIKYYRMALGKGVGRAMLHLGDMYFYGRGIEQNYEEAIKYYKMAVTRGDDFAMWLMGDAYEFGRGVEQNYKKARKYYKMASELRNTDAMRRIARFYTCGEGVEKNYKKAFKFLMMAIEWNATGIEENMMEFFEKIGVMDGAMGTEEIMTKFVKEIGLMDEQTRRQYYTLLMLHDGTRKYGDELHKYMMFDTFQLVVSVVRRK